MKIWYTAIEKVGFMNYMQTLHDIRYRYSRMFSLFSKLQQYLQMHTTRRLKEETGKKFSHSHFSALACTNYGYVPLLT